MNNGIGERIRSIREERGMTASQLARLVGVTPTAVWNWEKNGRLPREGVLSSLAKVLGTSSASLVSGTTQPANFTVAKIIENAKSQIADITGFPPERVKIQVEFVTE